MKTEKQDYNHDHVLLRFSFPYKIYSISFYTAALFVPPPTFSYANIYWWNSSEKTVEKRKAPAQIYSWKKNTIST